MGINTAARNPLKGSPTKPSCERAGFLSDGLTDVAYFPFFPPGIKRTDDGEGEVTIKSLAGMEGERGENMIDGSLAVASPSLSLKRENFQKSVTKFENISTSEITAAK